MTFEPMGYCRIVEGERKDPPSLEPHVGEEFDLLLISHYFVPTLDYCEKNR